MKHTIFILFTIAVCFGSFIGTIDVYENVPKSKRWNKHDVQQANTKQMVEAFRSRARDGL